MKKIIHSKYAPLFLAGLALIIICAWFSVGAFYYDEHFQVLEFCSYKMGNAVANSYSLPWEFYDKIRASLLPDIAFVIAKILSWCGLYNPFTLAFLLRLLAGVSGWFITCRICLLFQTYKPGFKTPKGVRLLILMSLFLWFIPFIGVRFTVENISGILLLYGIYNILSIDEKAPNTLIKYLIAGLLFGFSLFIREQMSFAIAGFAAWLIFINKTKIKYIFALAFSMVAAVGINVLLDYWFYGEWVFTPFNYYNENIVHHVAAMLNTSPWWFYFSEFITNIIPPLSWLLLLMFFIGVYKNLKDPFVWVILPFLVAHCIIGHKEFRFLFPVTFIFIYITALGVDYLLYLPPQPKGKKLPLKKYWIKIYYQRIHNYVFAISAIISVPLLIYRTLAPVQFTMYYNKFLYNHAPAKNTPLFYIPNRNEDMYYGLNTSFYKNPDLKTVLIDSMPQMGDYLRNNKPESALLFTTLSFGTSTPVKDSDKLNWNGYKIKMVYCFFPDWAFNYDINKWKEKNSIYKIYQFTPIDSLLFDVNKALRDPNSFHSHDIINFILSSAYFSLQNNKLDEAEKILHTVEENTRGAIIPHLHNYLGILYVKKNRLKEAENEFKTEIALNLQKKEAFLNLGNLYFQQKDYDSAVISMNNVVSMDPNNADALNNLGVYLLYIKKDYTQAMPYFIKALNLNVDYRQAYINTMICGQNSSYEQFYQRLLLDDRNDPYTWVMVRQGMPVSDIQAMGINVSYELVKKINSML